MMNSLLEYYRMKRDYDTDTICFEKVKEEDIKICGKTLKEVITILNGLEAQRRINKAIEYMNSEEFFMKMNSNSIQPPADKYVCQDYFEAKNKLVNILGGDVDDE